jgi:A/G-specific adenine glycosylase
VTTPTRIRADTVNRPLLKWYNQHARNLPWRMTRDPYSILVSEIMLQQTQVDRVIPVYSRFLIIFPTIQSLAAATPMAVIQAWHGLGYYRRAVRLHKLAQIITNDMQGRIPSSTTELIKLPGVGRYTAAAVACFAFNEQVAAFDVNISRVLHRLLGVRSKSKSLIPSEEFRGIIQGIIPKGSAANWNQALMDVGSRFCKRSSPLCSACPLTKICEHSNNLVEVEAQGSTTGRPKTIETRLPFKGSPRFFRGRIIRLLSGLEPTEPIHIDMLLEGINVDMDDDLKLKQAVFVSLLTAMETEGLIWFYKSTLLASTLTLVRLPS